MSLTHLPRWTVYPALAVIFGLLVVAVPYGADEESSGAARALRAEHQVPVSLRVPIPPSTPVLVDEAADESAASELEADPSTPDEAP